jgi:hypothetical protein
MDSFFTTYLIYPDSSPVKFLLTMLGVVWFAIWVGMKEDK